MWRDSQTIQAYLGGQIPITKLPSPQSWATRTAASCALHGGIPATEQKQNSGGGSGISTGIFRRKNSTPGEVSSSNVVAPEHHHYEEIMELKRQLASTNQDLHLTKVGLIILREIVYNFFSK